MNQKSPPDVEIGKLVLSPSQYYDPNNKGSNPYFGKSGEVFTKYGGALDAYKTKCWLNPKDDVDKAEYNRWMQWGMNNLKSIKVGIFEPADATRQSQPSQYQPSGDFQPATVSERKTAW